MNNQRGHKKDPVRAGQNSIEKHFDEKPEDEKELFICTKCGKSIKDLSAALADKQDGNPVHFDCVLNALQQSETLQENEALSYIGQGRFAVIKYASMVTMKEFSIIRIIEWEDKNHRAQWRGKIADRFSLID